MRIHEGDYACDLGLQRDPATQLVLNWRFIPKCGVNPLYATCGFDFEPASSRTKAMICSG